MMRFTKTHRDPFKDGASVSKIGGIVVLLCNLLFPAKALGQLQPPLAIVYDSDQTGTGQYEIYIQKLNRRNQPVGTATQLTNASASQQAAQEPKWSLAASADANINQDLLGRIVYQFGVPNTGIDSSHPGAARGLHIMKPLSPGNNGDLQLTPNYGDAYRSALDGPQSSRYPCLDARDPSWSPDGLHIVYACLEPLSSGAIGYSYNLWIHDTHGTPDDKSDDADYRLLDMGGKQALRPAWSPDGYTIALVTNAPATNGPATNASGPNLKIGFLNILPDELGHITYYGINIVPDPCSNDSPTWDPSSVWVAFSSTRDSAGACTGNRSIWRSGVAGDNLIQITGKDVSVANDTNPSWSSTGKYIAFSSNRLNTDGTYANRIWLVNAQDGTVTQISGKTSQYVGSDSTVSFGQSGLLGFDNDCCDVITPQQWDRIVAAGVNVFVSKVYGGVDTGRNCLVTPPYTQRSCQLNLLAAQQRGLATGAFVELTFTSNSDVDHQPDTGGYGTYAVTQSRSLVGQALWSNLDFVAIATEPASPTDLMWGSPSDHVVEIGNAVAEANKDSNPVIYARPDAKNYSWGKITAGTPDVGGTTNFRWLPLWEVAGGGPTLAYPGVAFGGWQSRQGKQYQLDIPNQFADSTGAGGINVDLDFFDPSILLQWPGNTAVGSNIAATVVDYSVGTALLTATFANVSQAGFTTVVSSATGPAPPSGYKPVTPQTYYDITTTALFTGAVQACLNYTGITYGIQANLALFHYVNNAWANVTSSSNPASNTICGSVTSLSPFAIFEQGSLTTPVVNVTGGTFTFDGAAHGASATATGTTGQAVSGTFAFTYTPGGSAAPVNPGTYSVTAQFTSSDPNYANASASGTITITSASTTSTPVPTGSMQFARVSHQATLLADGLVLVSGGQSGGTPVAPAELYNPATGTWSMTGSNVIPRFDHTATLLQDGRVLAAGGVSSIGDCSSNVTAEAYDPAKGTWSLVGRLPSPVGTGHIAIRLLDGRVLVSGGGDRCGTVFNTAAIFNPTTNSWSATGSMTSPREFHSAALLPDGRVLVAGGVTSSLLSAIASAEVFDPVAGTWTAVASMGTARQTSCNGYTQPYLASLSGGTVLAAGGFSGPNCYSITPQRTVAAATVSPSPVQFSNIGHALALNVTAQMSDGTTEPFTGPLQFSSGDATVATVDSSGLVTAVATGTTTITISATGIAAVSVPVTVASRQLTSITVSPTSIVAVGPGVSQLLAVNGQYSDGSQQALTTGVTFTSSNAALVTVDPTGLVTTVANGTATITVSAPGAPSVQVAVTVKSLVSIAVSPASFTLNTLGKTQPLTVTGAYSDGSQQVLTSNLSFISSNPLVARVDLSGFVTAVANGTATITVSAPGVTAAQVPVTVTAPVLTQVSPNSGPQASQNLFVTLTGQNTNWTQGTTTANFGAGITVAPVTVNSPTSATAVVNISATAATGLRTVIVTTGSEVDSLANSFTVSPGVPTLLSLIPAGGYVGEQNLTVALAGQFTNWVQGTTTANFGAGVTVASLTVVSTTSASAVLKIDPAAATGARAVILTTSTEVDTLANGFTVNPTKPTLLSVNPAIGRQGQQNLSVALTGQFTNWVQGTTTANFGAGISVSSLTVTSPTNATAVLNIDTAAVPGPRTVTLTTGSEIVTLTPGFTVSGAPEETDAKPFSVLNLAGVTGGQPLSLESDSTRFSVLNYAGVGTGASNQFEADAVRFSALNLSGMTGNQPVQMEFDALKFSVLNLAATGIGPGGQPTPFEVDGVRFSILNLAGENGSQPTPMESDGIPFSVQNNNPLAPLLRPGSGARTPSGTTRKPGTGRTAVPNGMSKQSGSSNENSTKQQDNAQPQEK
jgi:Bacterial Ig-like domain (group 2)/Kelch motif/WD40-like Beta Propeller Repeat/Galactose oxidase, central domain